MALSSNFNVNLKILLSTVNVHILLTSFFGASLFVKIDLF